MPVIHADVKPLEFLLGNRVGSRSCSLTLLELLRSWKGPSLGMKMTRHLRCELNRVQEAS